MPAGPMMAWYVEHLRFSAFHMEPADPKPVESWARIVGDEPEDIRIKGTGGERIVTQRGPLVGAKMQSDVRRDRTDWRLHVDPPESGKGVSAGIYRNLEGAFLEKINNWLKIEQPKIVRLGYGGVLRLEARSRLEALMVLNDLLPKVELDVENTWDFEYAINRRRRSKTLGGMSINRLSRWALAQVIRGTIEVPSDGSQPRIMTDTSYACQLTLDVNTIPENRDPLDNIDELAAELFAWGTEIATRGDIQ